MCQASYDRHLGFHVAVILKSKMAAIIGPNQVGIWSYFLEYICFYLSANFHALCIVHVSAPLLVPHVPWVFGVNDSLRADNKSFTSAYESSRV